MDDRAQIAYEAFNHARKSGRRGPPWTLLPEFEKEPWRAVAVTLDLPLEAPLRRANPYCLENVRDCNCAVKGRKRRKVA